MVWVIFMYKVFFVGIFGSFMILGFFGGLFILLLGFFFCFCEFLKSGDFGNLVDFFEFGDLFFFGLFGILGNLITLGLFLIFDENS